MASTAVDLSRSLSSHFAVIYGLALFLPSLIILLAGGFLTLDRTPSFDSHDNDDYEKQGPLYKAFNPNKKRSCNPWQFHGGVGGMLVGFVSGLHLASLMALVIANRTSAAPLSSSVFLVIWIIFALLFGISGARWSFIAVFLIALLGGASMALFVATAFHPSLTSRIVLLGLLVLVALCGTFVPIFKDRNLRRWTVRASGACIGSLGIIVSISIFSKVDGWASAWLRFVVKDGGEAWVTSKEKGLAVVFVLFAVAGVASDWILERKYGADPAPKWDGYLSHIPPWSSPAEGVFQPPRSFWQRLFRQQQAKQSPLTGDPRFPGTFDSLEASPMKEHSNSSVETFGEPLHQNPYSFPISVPKPTNRPLSLPPRFSTAYNSPSQAAMMSRRDFNEQQIPKPLSLPPQIKEVYHGDGARARTPLSIPTPTRPSLQPYNGSTSSLALSGATAVEIGLADNQSNRASHKQASASDVDVVDITEERDADSQAAPPVISAGEDKPLRNLYSPTIPRPRPARSFASAASSSRSREVLPIPEEEPDNVADQPPPAQVSSSQSNAAKNPGGRLELPEYPYTQTPSLIRAIDRIRRAHADALAQAPNHEQGTRAEAPNVSIPYPQASSTAGAQNVGGVAGNASSPLFDEGEWEAFWGDVRSKAALSRPNV